MSARFALSRDALARQVRVDTYRASGPGGQHVNRTESAVRLVHLPTGITVTASDTRSQARNRELAFARLAARLERMQRRAKPRKATRVPLAEKRRRVEEKKREGRLKSERRAKWGAET